MLEPLLPDDEEEEEEEEPVLTEPTDLPEEIVLPEDIVLDDLPEDPEPVDIILVDLPEEEDVDTPVLLPVLTGSDTAELLPVDVLTLLCVEVEVWLRIVPVETFLFT